MNGHSPRLKVVMTRVTILAMLALVLSCAPSRQAGPGDRAARRPPPVWTVDGRVLGVERSVPDSPATYVSIVVQPDREQPVRVELAPGWYLDRRGLRFSEADRVQVEGRRERRDGGAVVVARRIRTSAGVVELRDADERPAWTR